MKKIKFEIILFIFLFLFSPVQTFSQDNIVAKLYTDFTGTEFSEDSGVFVNTEFTVEIVNEMESAFSGKLIYAFYNTDGALEGVEEGSEIAFAADEESKTVTHTTQYAYPNAETLKVMLWDSNNTLKPLAVNITAQKATGANGPSSQYMYFEEQPDDKLKEQMPVPFNIENYQREDIALCNFDDFDFDRLKEENNIFGTFTQSWCPGIWSIEKSGGIDNTPCVTLKMSEEIKDSRFQISYKDDNAKDGDWYYMSFKVRGENVDNSGSVKPYIDFTNDNGITVSGAYGENADFTFGNSEWTECYVIDVIDDSSNVLSEESDYYCINLNAFMSKMPSDSVVYIDDFKICKVIFEPMDTVLMYPNYKGFIYGDNGICDVNLKININDYNGSYDLMNLSVICRIVDENNSVLSEAELNNVEKNMEVNFSSNNLELGKDYYLQTFLKENDTGDILQMQEWTLRKRNADYRPETYVDEYGRFVKNGIPMFPIFQGAVGYDYEENIRVLSDTCVDAFTIGGRYHTEYRTPFMQKFRESMEEKNLGGLLETCGYVYSMLDTGLPMEVVKKQSDIRGLLTVMLNNFKNDPRLWAYRNFDEMNATFYGEELRWQNDIMSSLDPDHPTTGITDKLISNRPGIYSKTVDIIGVDPYYCTGKENQNLSKVGETVRKLKELNPNKPVFITLQGFWYKDRGDLRGPTQQEYRNMAWQAICEGVMAIDNYAYYELKNNPWNNKSVEELWNEQMIVLNEIKDLEPVILSIEPKPHYEMNSDTLGFITDSRRYKGKSYVFAVNLNNSSNKFAVKLEGATGAVNYFNSNALEKDTEGYFNIMLEPYGVAILEVEQDDFLSPNAELIHFGVTNGDHSYLITETNQEMPKIHIDNNSEYIDYSIRTSDESTVYINGEERQSSGKISIIGIDEIQIEVVSEDKDNYSKKSYSIVKEN